MINLVGAAKKVAVCATLGIAAAGCASVGEMESKIYRHSCDNLGIERGTDAYSECVLQQQRLDAERIEGFLDRNAGY